MTNYISWPLFSGIALIIRNRAEQVNRETDKLTDVAPDPNAIDTTFDIETTWDISEKKLHAKLRQYGSVKA